MQTQYEMPTMAQSPRLGKEPYLRVWSLYFQVLSANHKLKTLDGKFQEKKKGFVTFKFILL